MKKLSSFFILLLVVVSIAFAGDVFSFSVAPITPIYKESVAYTEAAASFLAKEYKEYNDAETSGDKKTIMQYVVMRYPNLDTDSIDNDELRRFYNKCLNN